MTVELQAYPPGAKRLAGSKLSKDVLERLRLLKMIAGKRAPRTVDCITLFSKIDKVQAEAAAKPTGPRRKKTKKAVSGEKAAQQARVGSYRALQELREGLADHLLDQFGVGPFLPVSRKGRRVFLTTAWSEDESLHRFVSVVDDNERDVSGWIQERIYSKGRTFTVALARDFYEVARRHARVIRIWLPSIRIAVLFTPTGKAPGASRNKEGPVVLRGGHREYRAYPLTTLWDAIGIKK